MPAAERRVTVRQPSTARSLGGASWAGSLGAARYRPGWGKQPIRSATLSWMMAGRPSKLTPERAQAIALAVSEGHYLQHAAAAAGVARSTVHSWLARDRKARERLDGGGEPEPDDGAISGLSRRGGGGREVRRRAGYRPDQGRDGATGTGERPPGTSNGASRVTGGQAPTAAPTTTSKTPPQLMCSTT